VAVVVLALHGLLLLMWSRSLAPRGAEVAAPAPTLQWVRLPPLPVAGPTPTPATAPAVPPRPRPAQPLLARTPTDGAWALQAPAAEAPASAASAPPRPASAPLRLALPTGAAAAPLLSERAAAAAGMALERQDQALGQGVAGAAHRDCLRDAAPGGLLGLPLIAYQALAGRCAR
jgi:hypothetical protein